MNRLAKSMRVMCGLLLLLHLAVFFVPVTNIMRQYSAGKSELAYSQFDYVVGMAGSELPHDEYLEVEEFREIFYVIVAGFMMMPFLVSLVGGIYGMGGGQSQIVSGICSLIVFGCYLAQFLMLEQMWPVNQPGVTCGRAVGSWLSLAISGLACLTGILTFVFVPGRKRETPKEIPHVREIKRKTQEPSYHVADLSAGPSVSPLNDPSAGLSAGGSGGRGVMVGLTGMYAGAEIPFEDGMKIRLGRLPDNDLVFTNEAHVSRRHCEISWHAPARQFGIKDFSSSGSYINGSEDCLPQNIDTPLPPGTILDIGDENNRFRLEWRA